jgi:hypothetical protein
MIIEVDEFNALDFNLKRISISLTSIKFVYFIVSFS